MKEPKKTSFKINAKKRNIIIASGVAVVVVIAGIVTGVVTYHNNSVKTELAEATTDATVTDENETTEVAEVEDVEETEVTTEKTKAEKTTEADTTNDTTRTGNKKTASNNESVDNSKSSTSDTKKVTHTHSYTSSVTTQPTCGQNGVRTYKCSCGDTYTESVAATGNHNYVQASCTSDTCSTCGATRSADHHNWVTTTQTIEVPAVTHTEMVDQCDCGAILRTNADFEAHDRCGGFANCRITVVDSEATTRTETITSCSVCGTTK